MLKLGLGIAFNINNVNIHIILEIDKMISGIYSIINKTNGKKYIGSSMDVNRRVKRHLYDLKRGKHHNAYLQRSYDKHGKESFEFIILEETENLFERELFWIENIGGILYNIGGIGGGDNLTNHPERENIILRISETLTTKASSMTDKERKEKYGNQEDKNGMYGRCHTSQSKQKMSNSLKEYYKINKSKSIGRKHSEETKSLLSKKASERTGDKNPFYGKTHSKETKEKIAKSNRGRIPTNTRRVIADGVSYDSVTECSKVLYVSPALIIYRIKSDNYNYHYE